MRWIPALVALLMLSGCLSSGNDDPKETTPGTTTETDGGLRGGVVFYNEPYEALPDQPVKFTVQVPEGSVNVKLEMSVTGSATPFDEADVSLSGCGQGHVSWNPGSNIVIAVSGGGSWRQADLCSTAVSGSRTITVDTGATPMVGRILLRADMP